MEIEWEESTIRDNPIRIQVPFDYEHEQDFQIRICNHCFKKFSLKKVYSNLLKYFNLTYWASLEQQANPIGWKTRLKSEEPKIKTELPIQRSFYVPSVRKIILKLDEKDSRER